MGKKKQSNNAETSQGRQEEIHRLTEELRRLREMHEKGQIGEEQLILNRLPLVRRRLELTDQERRETWKRQESDIGFWSAVEADLPNWSKDKRESFLQLLKREIEKFAPKEKLNDRADLYEELEGWIDKEGCILLFWQILTYMLHKPWHQEFSEEMRRERKASRDYYRKRSKGKGQRTPEPSQGFQSIIMTLDEKGRSVFEVPGDKVGRPPKKSENELMVEIYNLLRPRGLGVQTIYTLLRDIFDAFVGKRMTGRAIQRAILRHLSE